MTGIPTKVDSSDSPQDSALHYDQFLGPLFFEPYAIQIAKLFDPSTVSIALEIAAGTGRVTRHIRERLGASSKLIASDISEDMLAEAKKKPGHLQIEWQNIDAQQLPFKDDSIDLVVCSFGYMFAADKAKAFQEAYRVLKPGGLLLFSTWDRLEHNMLSYTARSVAEKYLKATLPESYDLAVSMSDPSAIRQRLEEAGLVCPKQEQRVSCKYRCQTGNH